MSIQHLIHIVNRNINLVADLQKKYALQNDAALELNKLKNSLENLHQYLSQLDHLKPNYTTNDLQPYMNAIYLHLDILNVQLSRADFRRLNRGIKAIKVMLHFHRHTYTFISFCIAWLVELIYFI